MPGGDGTGPMGAGPGSGWGLGGCVPRGRGLRVGRTGFGRGRRGFFGRAFGAFRGLFCAGNAESETTMLREELAAINARLAEIEKEKK